MYALGLIVAEEWSYTEFTNSVVYKALMMDINIVAGNLTNAVNAVQKFRKGGVDAFISAVVNDEEAKVRQKQDQLNLLLSNNSAEQQGHPGCRERTRRKQIEHLGNHPEKR